MENWSLCCRQSNSSVLSSQLCLDYADKVTAEKTVTGPRAGRTVVQNAWRLDEKGYIII